ncbi:MAG TPA: SigE family RNA polymerase sigma factor [Micromonosporaceae bacterium]|nr:SigE family RNA polymerase sigma factor [Micromonosporaceae bacterium]
MIFEDWVAARGDALLRFALMVTADPGRAEDVVQTVLARVYLRWDRVGSLDAPEAYVKAAIVNEHLRWWRRRSSREVPVDAPTADGPDGRPDADIAGRHASRDAAWALLGRLPHRQRAVLALRYYEDMSDDAIAAVLGCSAGTVRSQASRALAALRVVVPSIAEEAMP